MTASPQLRRSARPQVLEKRLKRRKKSQMHVDTEDACDTQCHEVRHHQESVCRSKGDGWEDGGTQQRELDIIAKRHCTGRYGRIDLPISLRDFSHGRESRVGPSLRGRLLDLVLEHLASWSVFSALLYKTYYKQHLVGSHTYSTMGWTLAHVLFILNKACPAMHDDDDDAHAVSIDENSILAAMYISDQWAVRTTGPHTLKRYLMYHPAVEQVENGYNALMERSQKRIRYREKQGLQKEGDKTMDYTRGDSELKPISVPQEIPGTFESLVPRLVQQQVDLLHRADYRIHASIDDLSPWKLLLDSTAYFWYFENYTISTAHDISGPSLQSIV